VTNQHHVFIRVRNALPNNHLLDCSSINSPSIR